MIRLIISSYFIAISLGQIDGLTPGYIFQGWLGNDLAEILGVSIMAGTSLFIFFGLFLRFSCLYLALLVLSSSVAENIFAKGMASPEALWSDVVMVSVLLLLYGGMTRQGLSDSALLRLFRKNRRIHPTERVEPRRIRNATTPARRLNVIEYASIRENLNGRTEPEPEVTNIFSETEAAAG
ncbi:hypothetical protein [Arenibacterium sp. CAU 1754]